LHDITSGLFGPHFAGSPNELISPGEKRPE
jgi:hypothetical protein